MKISMTSVALATLMARNLLLQFSSTSAFHISQINDTFDHQFVVSTIDNVSEGKPQTIESLRNEFFEDELPSMAIAQKIQTETKEYSDYTPRPMISQEHNDDCVGSSCSNNEGSQEEYIPTLTFKNNGDVLVQSKVQIFSQVMSQFKEGLIEESKAREISKNLGLSWDNFIEFFKALDLLNKGLIEENEFRYTCSMLGFSWHK